MMRPGTRHRSPTRLIIRTRERERERERATRSTSGIWSRRGRRGTGRCGNRARGRGRRRDGTAGMSAGQRGRRRRRGRRRGRSALACPPRTRTTPRSPQRAGAGRDVAEHEKKETVIIFILEIKPKEKG